MILKQLVYLPSLSHSLSKLCENTVEKYTSDGNKFCQRGFKERSGNPEFKHAGSVRNYYISNAGFLGHRFTSITLLHPYCPSWRSLLILYDRLGALKVPHFWPKPVSKLEAPLGRVISILTKSTTRIWWRDSIKRRRIECWTLGAGFLVLPVGKCLRWQTSQFPCFRTRFTPKLPLSGRVLVPDPKPPYIRPLLPMPPKLFRNSFHLWKSKGWKLSQLDPMLLQRLSRRLQKKYSHRKRQVGYASIAPNFAITSNMCVLSHWIPYICWHVYSSPGQKLH